MYSGKLSSGKSVLLANIVDDLNLHVENTDTSVTYFFCRHDMSESLKARTVIGSLARQLLCLIPDLSMVAELLSGTQPVMDVETILELLRRALPVDYKAFFILDGIDECDHAERRELARQLRDLQSIIALRLCVSLRLEPNNTSQLSSAEFLATQVALIHDDNPDIEEYINTELERSLDSGKLALGNPTLILDIRNTLLAKSNGMFLWVALQIESLCIMKTDEDIRQALADLPRDLAETFSRILKRSRMPGKTYQTLIFHLVLSAFRPLSTEEIREALAVIPGETSWNPNRLSNDIFSTLSCCGSLLIIDEEELIVRLVHHSVKQFLLSGGYEGASPWHDTHTAHMVMIYIMDTYLRYNVLDTQLSTTLVPQVMAGTIPSTILNSAIDSSSKTRSIALKILKSRKALGPDIGKVFAGKWSASTTRTADEFRFHSYAKSYWLQHIICFARQHQYVHNYV